MRRIVVGVMGPGEGATEKDLGNAFQLGRLLAKEGWIVLTGGRRSGVMDAASRGAKKENGLTVGVLPSADESAISEAVDIAILTDMGNARNNINVLSSHVVVACGMGIGTASEIALALKAGKQVVILSDHPEGAAFFRVMGGERVTIAGSPAEAVAAVREALKRN
jgi:uncharacterized protein (TIGR00725 family)